METKIWRLSNPSILNSLQHTWTEYFAINGTPGVSPLLQWEGHKCVAWGAHLAMAVKHKREHQATLLKLTIRTAALGTYHKRSQAQATHQKLQ